SFYFSPASTVKLLFSPSCWLPESSAPPSGFRCFLPEGRGFYRLAALPVNRCFPLTPSTRPPFLPGCFVGGAVSTTTASPVNSLR
ncbi:hypothetical protein, partial [Myxococcus sp. AM009]|uniref:hypothetical protein n=1 Tax=Myxococcus sp. AM009 TaxID=2745137 RepID=UPI001C3E8016